MNDITGAVWGQVRYRWKKQKQLLIWWFKVNRRLHSTGGDCFKITAPKKLGLLVSLTFLCRNTHWITGCFYHKLSKPPELFLSQRSLPYFSWNNSSESEMRWCKSPLQIPLSSGLLSGRRAAQGCSVWQSTLGWPVPENAMLTAETAQYSGSCVCDETETEALAFLPANFPSAIRADVFAAWVCSVPVTAAPRGSSFWQGAEKSLILCLFFVSLKFCGLLGIVFVLPNPSPDGRGRGNTRLQCTLCVGYSHKFRQGSHGLADISFSWPHYFNSSNPGVTL